MMCECDRHRYHVDMEFGIVEFLPSEGSSTAGGRIISTGLQNPVMPLIRYDTGDLATLADGPCPCGRHSPTAVSIDGRIEAVIVTPDGRQLGRLDHLFKGDSKILEAQFVQENVESLTVRIVRDDDYRQKDEDEFLHDLRTFVGDSIKIDFEYVSEIPRGPNAKFRQVISSVRST